MASVIAFRGRNAIIDLTAYNLDDRPTIPGITDTIKNLLKKDFIVWLRLNYDDSVKNGLLALVTDATESATIFHYFDFAERDRVAVYNDLFGGGIS